MAKPKTPKPAAKRKTAEPAAATQAPLVERLWAYQAERFPVLKHGIIIAVLSWAATGFSAQLRAADAGWWALLAAFLLLFSLFAQLRICDEFKDAELDAQFRPERPVPRGLVSLDELRRIGLYMAGFQALVALASGPAVFALLLLVWGYMALMTKEFFVPEWLTKQPALYLLSHMVIMPLIVLLATACDWAATGFAPKLFSYLVLAFANGIVLEIGRKTWTPERERTGVETYSAIWGIWPSVGVWTLTLLIAMQVAIWVWINSLTGTDTNVLENFMLGLGAIMLVNTLTLAAIAAVTVGFANKKAWAGKLMEHASATWVLVINLVIALICA